MQKACAYICKLLACPFAVSALIILVSFGSLAAALIAEIVFELEPCILCVYQRIPFVIGLVLGLVSLILLKANKERGKPLAPTFIGLSGLGFLVNSGIAFYHTGVELHWWKSAVEGCAVPNFGDDTQSLIENILSAPTARCDEIPWADPIIGLSMANYNIVLCFGLFLMCLLAVLRQRQAHSEQSSPSE